MLDLIFRTTRYPIATNELQTLKTITNFHKKQFENMIIGKSVLKPNDFIQRFT